jgi:hypothetical protein
MSKLLRGIIFRTLTEIKGDNCDVLAVFDFDDTLVTSDSQVVVTHQNGKSEELSSSEYAVYVEQPGDEFDYSQFNDTTTAEPTAIFGVLQHFIQKCGGDSVAILTARGVGSQLALEEFFSDQLGLELKNIVTVGSSDPKAKALKIREFANLYKPSVIHFYDDSQANIDAVKKEAASWIETELADKVEVFTHRVDEFDRKRQTK